MKGYKKLDIPDEQLVVLNEKEAYKFHVKEAKIVSPYGSRRLLLGSSYFLVLEEALSDILDISLNESREIVKKIAIIRGFDWVKRRGEKILGIKGSYEILNRHLQLLTNCGWGKFILEEFDKEHKEVFVKVLNSVSADSFLKMNKNSPANEPMCLYILGHITGAVGAIFGLKNWEESHDKILGNEIKCRAMNSEFCLFEIRRIVA